MEIRSFSGDRRQRRLQQILSFIDGSLTSDQGMDEQKATPKLELQTPKKPSISLQRDHSSSIAVSCKRFNRYAQYLGATTASHQPSDSANAVRDTLAEIEKILEQASNSIKEKTAQLEGNVKQFSMDVPKHADAKWYRQVEDITALEGKELLNTFEEMPAVNVDDFAQYLQELLPAVARKPRPGHEVNRTFAWKVGSVLEYTVDRARVDYPTLMRLYTTVRASVFIPGQRPEHPRIFREFDDKLMSISSHHSTKPDSDNYWDFAASWRELVNGWAEANCYHKTGTDGFLQLLSCFRAKAHWEIQQRVKIAVGGRLPVELEDAIFEQAMLAEEIPLQD